MNIRLATLEDVPGIQRIAERSWELDYPETVSRETVVETVKDWYGDEDIETELERPDATVLVADTDGEIGGFVHAIYSAGDGHIMRVYVDPDARGAGLGGSLVDAATDRLFSQGADRVRAMVLSVNEPGNDFYRALGFDLDDETYETRIGDEFYEERVWVKERAK